MSRVFKEELLVVSLARFPVLSLSRYFTLTHTHTRDDDLSRVCAVTLVIKSPPPVSYDPPDSQVGREHLRDFDESAAAAVHFSGALGS